MKRFMLALAALAMFLTTVALPSLADGMPEPVCNAQGCQLPPSN
ncbi:MAG: hypothetical protein WCF61_18500 [Terriglobales bacterium]